jgi:dTDP-4-amino-4,6-dideoxygalactose transaminase
MIKFLDLKEINKKYQTEINDAVKRVAESGWYLLGQEVKEFEREFAEYIRCIKNYIKGLYWNWCYEGV